ncbi:Phosphoribosylglycinamide formyltransferase [Candidatus Calditenuaceae archaeon HR02]|nr:Phosphoribosylglycinamide formyltransferase [Candidatus Calditenuaceae archaeon HR02]
MRLAVLASGGGSIFQSIVDHVRLGVLQGVEVTLLVCNRPGAGALERARKSGVKSLLITSRRDDGSKKSKAVFESEIIGALKEHGIDLIFLAGWDKILDATVDEYPYRIMNSHPSLLPAFSGLYGLDVHRAVLDRGCKISGCTVHYVDKGVDTGPIILQRAVPVSEYETPETLAGKVKAVEQLLAPMAIQLHVDGRVSLVNKGQSIVTHIDYSGGWLEGWRERQQHYLEVRGEVYGEG